MRLGSTRFPPAVTGFLFASVWCALCTSAFAQKDTLPVESSLSFDPLVRLLGCLREDRPGFCFQKRALGYFESWLTTSEDEDDDTFDSDGAGEQLPAGISPQWNKLMDQVAERISGSYDSDKDDDDDDGDEGDEQSDDGNSRDNKLQKRDSTDVEGRGKYKKDKRVKVAMTVILLMIYFIINQLFYMFDKVARTFIFAKLLLALKIFVVVKLLELKRYLWWVKEEKKEVETHSELALHDHHYDDHHDYYSNPHEHYGPPHHPWGWHSRSELPDPHTQAYRAQTPVPAPIPPYTGYTPNPKMRRRRFTVITPVKSSTPPEDD